MSFDAKLAYLLNLGFDYEKCLTALGLYDDLQEASNWMLTTQFQDAMAPTTTQCTMPTVPTNSSTQISSSTDISFQDQKELERQRMDVLKRVSESKKQKRLDQQARQRVLNDIKEDRGHAKQLKPIRANAKHQQDPSAATTASTSSYTVAEDIQQTALSHIQQELKKQKKLNQVAKQRVLDDIRMDRQNKQQRKQPQNRQPTTSSSSSAVAPTATSHNDHNARQKTALIQFKLTNGSLVRQSFDGTALLESVYKFVTDQENGSGHPMDSDEHICLVSAFPRRTFGPEEGQISVQDAGFLPNVSLNINRVSTSISATPLGTMEMDENDDGDEEIYSASEDEDEEDDNFIRQPIADPHRSRRRHTDRLPFARQNRVTNPNWSWGRPGHRLGNEEDASIAPALIENTSQQEEEDSVETSRRQNMLTAIEQRRTSLKDNDSNINGVGGANQNKISKDVTSLKETCFSQVAAILSSSSKDTQRLLKNLVCISPDMASLLLSRLMATRKLDRLSLSRLVRHCYLQHVTLDSYVYGTDSLLEELSHANSLIKLVLRGCDLMTDAGIRYLEGLKYLEYLDVSDCKITDKGLKSITKLSSLVYLNLSKTHITDAGLQWFTRTTHCQPHLETLLLTGCKGIKSPCTFSSLQDFTALAHLSLGGTCIGKQEVAPKDMRQLNQSLALLDICRTDITDNDLVQLIAGFGQLKELKLGGCPNITTRGLARFANNMHQLEIIQFPDREHDLDDILIRFKDCPLRYLDLTGFLQVTDVGAQHIAKMTQLQYLSLSGTKVTDEGVAQLKGLQELEKLYLDKTNVTDAGLSQIKGLRLLNTLSLGRTKISNEGLQAMGNVEETNYALQLRTLNLQNCENVSDLGVKALASKKGYNIIYTVNEQLNNLFFIFFIFFILDMVNLSNLNLDHTGVSLQCVNHLKDLVYLKPVRLLGIDKVQDDGMDVM
ncbi:hypothetical protein BCR42DRAFT_403073 [Absidia repens]|uniref:UBX domain-containing protein n=1 Tax=Absidia repens TaxID=90262 RepID=A0A1X2IYY0_9FUNG|nr:hypothetical protein BCR42DRAFT_403073 [Absidia repens]